MTARTRKPIEVEFRIESAAAKAAALPMVAYLEMIRAWCDAVEAVACKGRPPAAVDHKITMRRIESGSANAVVLMPATHLRAVGTIGAAARSGRMDPIPQLARKAVKTCLELLGRARQRLAVVENRAAHLDAVVLQQPLVESAPVQIEGETTLVGRLRSVGGQDPNIHLEIGPGHTEIVSVTQTQARSIGQMLYMMIIADVRAFWDAERSTIERSTLVSWKPGPKVGLLDGIREHARRFGGDWEGVDGKSWLRKLRSE